MTSAAADRPLFRPLMPWIIVIVAIALIPILLRDTFMSMVRIWTVSSNFNHCFLIPPACFWLVWRQREQLGVLTPRLSIVGTVAVLPLGVLWVLGGIANAAIIQNLAAVALIPAAVWAILGTRVAHQLLFPLAYLFFMIPFGEFLIPRLMEYTADFTVAAVRLSGVSIYRDGLFFLIPAGSFKVVETCSGVRMLIAAVAIGTLFAHLTYSSWRRRIIFVLFAVTLALVANVIRAYLVVMGGHWFGIEAVADHVTLGYIVFGIVIVIMLLVGARYSDIDESQPRTERVDAPESVADIRLGVLPAVVVVMVAWGSPLTVLAIQNTVAAQAAPPPMPLPAASQLWFGPVQRPADWAPVFTGEFIRLSGEYVAPDAKVLVYVISYRRQQQGSELINSENRIFDAEHWIQVRDRRNRESTPNYYEIELLSVNGSRRLVRYWYSVDGEPAGGAFAIKLLELLNTLRGRAVTSSVVAISMEFADNDDHARDSLDSFMQASYGP